MERDTRLEDKIFETALLLLGVIGIVNIISNLAIKLPIYLNYKWIVIIAISILLLKLNQNEKIKEKVKLIFFIFGIYIYLPIIFLDSGGESDIGLAFAFLALMCVTLFFNGKTRTILVSSVVCVFVLMFVLQYTMPQLFRTFSRENLFYGRLIQIPLTLLIGYNFLRTFSDEYRQEKRVLNKYSTELEHFATKDSLTGLYNRRSFDMRFNDMTGNIEPEKESYLVLFDIDFFKKVNDNHGHMKGDQVIQVLANTTKSIFNQTSFISRWGGDEFAIIYNGNKDILENKIKSLNRSLNSSINIPQVTISSGITKISKDDMLDDVLKRADEALYFSKDNGRNRLTFR